MLAKRGIIPMAMALLVLGILGQQSLGWPPIATIGLLVLSLVLMIGAILAKKRISEQP